MKYQHLNIYTCTLY